MQRFPAANADTHVDDVDVSVVGSITTHPADLCAPPLEDVSAGAVSPHDRSSASRPLSPLFSHLGPNSGTAGPSEFQQVVADGVAAAKAMARSVDTNPAAFNRLHGEATAILLDAPWVGDASSSDNNSSASSLKSSVAAMVGVARLAFRAQMLGQVEEPSVAGYHNLTPSGSLVLRLPGQERSFLVPSAASMVHIWASADEGRAYVSRFQTSWAALASDRRVAGCVVELPVVASARICGQFCTVTTLPPILGVEDKPSFAPLPSDTVQASPMLQAALARLGAHRAPNPACIFASAIGRFAIFEPLELRSQPRPSTPMGGGGVSTSSPPPTDRQVNAHANLAKKAALPLVKYHADLASAPAAEVLSVVSEIRQNLRRSNVAPTSTGPIAAMCAKNGSSAAAAVIRADRFARVLKARAREYLIAASNDVAAASDELGTAHAKSMWREVSSSVYNAVTEEIFAPLTSSGDDGGEEYRSLWESTTSTLPDIGILGGAASMPPASWVAVMLADPALLEDLSCLQRGDLPTKLDGPTSMPDELTAATSAEDDLASTVAACSYWANTGPLKAIVDTLTAVDSAASAPATAAEAASLVASPSSDMVSVESEAIGAAVTRCLEFVRLATTTTTQPPSPPTPLNTSIASQGSVSSNGAVTAMDVLIAARLLLSMGLAGTAFGAFNVAAASTAASVFASKWFLEAPWRGPVSFTDATDELYPPPTAFALIAHSAPLQRLAAGLRGPFVRLLTANGTRLGDMDAVVAAAVSVSKCIAVSDPANSRVTDLASNAPVSAANDFIDAVCISLAAHAVGEPLGPHYVIAEFATKHISTHHKPRGRRGFPRRHRALDVGIAVLAAVLAHKDQLGPKPSVLTPPPSGASTPPPPSATPADDASGATNDDPVGDWNLQWDRLKATLLDVAISLATATTRAEVLAAAPDTLAGIDAVLDAVYHPAVMGPCTHPRGELLLELVGWFADEVRDAVPPRFVRVLQRTGRALMDRRGVFLPRITAAGPASHLDPVAIADAVADRVDEAAAAAVVTSSPSPVRSHAAAAAHRSPSPSAYREAKRLLASPVSNPTAAAATAVSPVRMATSNADDATAVETAADGTPLRTPAKEAADMTVVDAGPQDDASSALADSRKAVEDVETGRDIPVDRSARFDDDGLMKTVLFSHVNEAALKSRFRLRKDVDPKDFAVDPERRALSNELQRELWLSKGRRDMAFPAVVAAPRRKECFETVLAPEHDSRKTIRADEVDASAALARYHEHRVTVIRELEQQRKIGGLPSLKQHFNRTPSDKITPAEREQMDIHLAARKVQCAFRCAEARFERRFRTYEREVRKRQHAVTLAALAVQRFVRRLKYRRRQQMAGDMVTTTVTDAIVASEQ